jgi:hypothetical protein
VVSDCERGDSSRRNLLRAAAAGGAVALLSACGSGGSHPHTETVLSPAAQADVDLLNAALDVENRSIAVYTAAVPLLIGREHAAAKWFLGQELSHAALLATLIGNAGGKPHQPRSDYDLGHAGGRRGLVTLLKALEQAQLAAYLAAVSQVSPGSVRAAVAMMLAADAQHLSVLNLALRADPIPAAFVAARA